MDISDQLGSRIRQYRKKMGLTQEELAFNSGINISFLGDIERGVKKPSIETLEKLLKAFGVTFQEFFDFETAIKPFKDCTALEKLNVKLQGRSENEIGMIYSVIQQILIYNDDKKTKP
jgi:transcriptional regulator with XRE-family HTH domain